MYQGGLLLQPPPCALTCPLPSPLHPCPLPCRFSLEREQLLAIIAAADSLTAEGRVAQRLTTNDATMLLAAFEAFGSAEGLALLKR